MPTIEDVAREAGVSTATVSRIIHNSSQVLPETRRKVEEVIERLNYHPNRLARQFRTQRTGNILVLLPEPDNSFFHGIIAGIESVAAQQGYHVLIAATHNDPAQITYYFECLQQKQIDGIITFSAEIDPETLQKYASQFPIVAAIRYYKGMKVPNVTIDNRKAARDITSYLLNLGHRQVACLAGDTDIILYRDRLDGFFDAMKERGLEADPSLIIRSDVSIESGLDAAAKLLGAGVPFTGIVTCGDTMAIGAARALKNAGIKVPDDVAVTGFDDIPLSALFSPPLTTVRQPRRQIGIRCMEKLLDLIEGRPLPNRQEVLPYELVIRESSGNFIG
ncbi:MAG: LacI family DNA-binding transcriptional regulator [Lachnospiraceae bacterium]|nr:LacI family DNA-binding transcriptional regulator [Lachnospiraceae bacterium]